MRQEIETVTCDTCETSHTNSYPAAENEKEYETERQKIGIRHVKLIDRIHVTKRPCRNPNCDGEVTITLLDFVSSENMELLTIK